MDNDDSRFLVASTTHRHGHPVNLGGMKMFNLMRATPLSEVEDWFAREWVAVAAVDMMVDLGIRSFTGIETLREVNSRLPCSPVEDSVLKEMSAFVGDLAGRRRRFAKANPGTFREQDRMRVSRWWMTGPTPAADNDRSMAMDTMKVNGKVQDVVGGAFGKESRAADLLWKMKFQNDKFDEMMQVARAESTRLEGAEDKISEEHRGRTLSQVKHFETGKARLEEQIRQLEESHLETLHKIDSDRDAALETVSERQTLWAKRLAVVEGLADIG